MAAVSRVEQISSINKEFVYRYVHAVGNEKATLQGVC
jgi:hypothetical protein